MRQSQLWPYGAVVPSLPIPALAEDAILLRPWEPADVAQQLAAFRDPLLQQHSDWAPENEEAAHQALLDQESAREQGLKLDLAVVGRTSPADVWGGVSLNSVDREQARAAVVTDSAQRHADEALRVAPSDSSPPGPSTPSSWLGWN